MTLKEKINDLQLDLNELNNEYQEASKHIYGLYEISKLNTIEKDIKETKQLMKWLKDYQRLLQKEKGNMKGDRL